jgi:hypothetical protein
MEDLLKVESTRPMTVPVRVADLVTRQVAGECIIVPVRSGVADLDSLYTLNTTASWLWDRLDGHTSEPDLSAALASEFEVDPAVALADVTEIIDDLCDEGLVRRVPGPTAAGAQE